MKRFASAAAATAAVLVIAGSAGTAHAAQPYPHDDDDSCLAKKYTFVLDSKPLSELVCLGVLAK